MYKLYAILAGISKDTTRPAHHSNWGIYGCWEAPLWKFFQNFLILQIDTPFAYIIYSFRSIC